MKEIQSLTVSQDLILRIKDLICCPETHEICRDDGFCGSNTEDWPALSNGTTKTRLTYPEDPKKPSIPDVPNFCSNYTSWYAKSNCGVLAKDIARGLSNAGSCPTGVDPKDYINRILRKVPRQQRGEVEKILKEQLVGPAWQQCEKFEQSIKAMQVTLSERCEILYDRDASGEMRFNEDRAEGLRNIASFCRGVEEAEAKRVNWKTFGGGGAATGVGGIIVYYASRLLKALKGVKDIDETTAGAARGVRRFFSFSLPNLGKALGYAFSLKWIRGEKPPPELPDPSHQQQNKESAQKIEIHVHQNGQVTSGKESYSPKLSELVTNVSAEEIDPRDDVVMAQFANLTQSKRYAKEGERFAELTETAQLYLANDIIDKWKREPIDIRQLFTKDDSRPLHGKIPVGYLLKFSRKYLKPEMMSVIEASAKVWAETGKLGDIKVMQSALVKDFKPGVDEVYRQLIHDVRYDRAGGAVQEYLARQAIAHWESLSQGERASFLTEKDRPEIGSLPTSFIRFFRKKMIPNPQALKLHATVFLQLLQEVPGFTGIPFSIIDRRTELIIRAWNMLPAGVQEAFRIQDGFSRLPHEQNELPSSFIGHMRPALQVGVVPRRTLLPVDEPWKPEDSPPFPYRGFDLRMVMSSIVFIDSNAALYPTLLGQRARSIVDAWTSLAPGVRARFINDGSEDYSEVASTIGEAKIPDLFVSLWYSASPGIGINSRDTSAYDDDAAATAPARIGEGSEEAKAKPEAGESSSKAVNKGVKILDAGVVEVEETDEIGEEGMEATEDELDGAGDRSGRKKGNGRTRPDHLNSTAITAVIKPIVK